MAKNDNEPELPLCLGGSSLVSVPTTGMRLAPEVLVFELFRELGQGDARDPNCARARDFSDVVSSGVLSDEERLLLSTCRGRRKNSRSLEGKYFYAPPYLGLARHAWFRKQSDRTLRDYFLGGPLAGLAALERLDKSLVARALLGHRSASPDEKNGKEILSLLACDSYTDPSLGEVLNNITTAVHPRSAPLVQSRHNVDDRLASVLTEDFLELCRLEERIARREWLFFLIAFLRTATTMWMLAHLRITKMVRDWVFSAANRESTPTLDEIYVRIRDRYEGLLHPSSTPTREVFEHVETYMRARVELRIIVGQLSELVPEAFVTTTGEHKTLSLDQRGAPFLALGDLLNVSRNCDWTIATEGKTLQQWLTRKAERYPAWRSPRTRGQGKNIDEFIRVVYRLEEDESDSGLLIRCPGTTTKIVPGHRLLQLFTFLAARSKLRMRGRARGKLVLRDIEQHLYNYGIDFRSSSFGRPLLLEKLMEGGLLVGSPDAGESAEVLETVGGKK